MSELTLKAENRTEIGKKAKKLLKPENKSDESNQKLINVPAAIYGYQGNYNIKVQLQEFLKVFNEASYTSLVKVELDGKEHNVFIQEVQIDSVKRIPLHISFREIDTTKPIDSTVPFILKGAELSPAVKEQNAIVILAIQEIDLRGLPKDLPKEVVVDVSKFNSGDHLILEQIDLGQDVNVVHKEDLKRTIVTTIEAEMKEEVVGEISSDAEGVEEVENTEGAESTPNTEATAGEDENK